MTDGDPSSSSPSPVPTPLNGNGASGRSQDDESQSAGSEQKPGLLARFFGRGKNGESVRETLQELIQDPDSEDSAIDPHERLLLSNIIHMRDVTAYDVMVPRVDVVAVDTNTTVTEVTRLMAEKGHSRLPVYRETLDDVAGMIHIKDLLAAVSRNSNITRIHPLVRPLLFVSPTMRVMDLIIEMRVSRKHMALVVDEYGGIDGLVTIEDLMEQIVGEIADEHDVDVEPELAPLKDGSWKADARLPIEDFEEVFGQVLLEEEREDVDTLGGLVFHMADRIPDRGELLTHDSGIEFKIIDADPRRIRKIGITAPLGVDDAASGPLPAETAKPDQNRG